MSLEAINARYAAQVLADPIGQGQVLVPGEGLALSPRLMLVGEAPGEQETLQRRPFVGKAGQVLDGFLQRLALRREEIYITNVVKWRPSKVSPRGRLSNRPPNSRELSLFIPWLMAETEAVSPRLLLTLGNTPLRAYLGKDSLIGAQHGRLQTTPQGWRHVALYHPAALIYNRALMAVYEEDLIRLSSILSQMPGG